MEISLANYESIKNGLMIANENSIYELECVFLSQKLTKQSFSSVLNYLFQSKLFKLDEKINRESLDISLLNSNYRLTIENQNNIVDFCKTDVLSEYYVMKKAPVNGFENIKLSEYDIYFKMKSENIVPTEEVEDEKFKKLFNTSNKFFRNKKRYSFFHTSNLFRVDVTIVKTSSKTSKTLDGSGLLSSRDKFEIEIEYLNEIGKSKSVEKEVIVALFNIIEIIKKVMDDTSFLVTKTQKELVLIDYLNLVNPKVFESSDINGFMRNVVYKRPKSFFLSYQPVTLEQPNLLDKELGRISIKEDYCVTEKADGERMLLYVDKNNNVYMIDSRLNVRSVGVKHKYANSLVDGEFVKKSKYKTNINTFMAFDIYFMENKDTRNHPLLPKRFDILKDFCTTASSQFKIKPKKYHEGKDIFKISKEVYDSEKYDYHIDGLIYTPIDLYVGVYYKGEESTPNSFGGTWMNVMKWKPPSENSVDMLTVYGEELFIPDIGRCVLANLQVSYKSNTDELIDPIKVLSNTTINNKAFFVSKTFVTVYLKLEDGSKKPKTMNGELIYNNTIVEYAYDGSKTEFEAWIPYRVRQDKTELYQTTGNIMGTANSYLTAVNVWRSIQNPVTIDMISGLQTLQTSDIIENNVYYARNVNRMKILSKPMLTFHNKEIKSKLFSLFKNSQSNLVDLACGKAGDLYKWIDNRYKSVVGFDINLDNIMNSNDGAYKRLYQAKQLNNKLNAVFLQKDVSKPWIDTTSIENDTMRELYDILWGTTKRKDVKNIPMLKYYNIMQSQFEVVSCQFAIHYMFATDESLETFCANVNKVMKEGGYFMGTCLDGAKVNELLESTEDGKKLGKLNENVIWMLKKKYDKYEEMKTGQLISVYLESINRIYDEYLVDLKLLEDKLAKYNIKVLTQVDLNKLEIKSSIGNFKDWYDKEKYPMADVLKEYSFLNTWFVFKKYPK